MLGLLIFAGIIVGLMIVLGAWFWLYDRLRLRLLGKAEVERREGERIARAFAVDDNDDRLGGWSP